MSCRVIPSLPFTERDGSSPISHFMTLCGSLRAADTTASATGHQHPSSWGGITGVSIQCCGQGQAVGTSSFPRLSHLSLGFYFRLLLGGDVLPYPIPPRSRRGHPFGLAGKSPGWSCAHRYDRPARKIMDAFCLPYPWRPCPLEELQAGAGGAGKLQSQTSSQAARLSMQASIHFNE